LAAGYEGIRVSGYAGWLQTREWPDFWKYEGSLNKSIDDLTEDDARSALSRAVRRSDRHLIEKNIEFLGSAEGG
jgi:hypothetical protein